MLFQLKQLVSKFKKHGTLLIATIFLIITTTLLLLRATFSHHSLPPSPTALPIIGHLHLLGPLIHQTFRDLASRHGPLFYLRLGSVPVVVASTPELAKELLKTHESKFTSRKRNKAIEKLTYGSSSFAFAPYGPYWKFIKKLCMGELLGYRTIANFLPVRAHEYRLFLRLLMEKSEAGEAVNLTDELMKLTNNVISQMIFGLRSSGTDGEAGEVRSVVRQVTEMFGEFNASDFIWFCKKVDMQGLRKRIEETHSKYDALLEKIITERKEVRDKRKSESHDGEERVKDFLDILLDAEEDQNAEIQITSLHIKAMVLDFFTAATDTTAIATEWWLAELINHPDVLQKAREEIDRVVGRDRLVRELDGPNLPYIQAIIKESFRLHPPIPMIIRKSIEECNIGDYVIPTGTMLCVNIWAIGRDPKYWEGPLNFKPERFLSEPNGLMDVKGQHFELLPFGSGRRGCPGISLAMQELPVMLAAMIQCFDWKLVGPNGGVNVMKGDDVVLDMSERPGLTAPRAHDLICFPVARFNSLEVLDL